MTAPKPLAPTSVAINPDPHGAPQPVVLVIAGFDKTKTQTLKNVNGTLTWVTDTTP